MFLTAAPSPSSSPGDEARRAGATWVAASGAFLLVAAAAVFVAVRWDRLPDAAKLAVVTGLTGAFLAGGRALRRTLPATGDVLFHLGAFLIPVDVAGICVRSGVGWRTTLLVEGIVGVGVLGALANATRSVVLRWAAGASVIVLAAGIAAVTPLPAPLLLAAAALAAHLTGSRRAAIGWAAVAGISPVLAIGLGNSLAYASGRELGIGTLTDLGLAGQTAAIAALVSGAASAFVLGREAGRTRDLGLVALAGVSLLCSAGTTWAVTDPSADVALLTAPSIFLAVELGAMLARRDDFWRRPASFLGISGEVVAAVVGAPIAALLVLLSSFAEEGLDLFGDGPGLSPDPVAATALALLASGWLVAGWRRQSPKPSITDALRATIGDDRTVLFTASAIAAAVVIGTASTFAAAGVLLLIAGGLALTTRGVLATLVTVFASAWAPVTVAVSHDHAVLPIALAASACVLASAITWRHQADGATSALLVAAAAGIAIAGTAQATTWLDVTVAGVVGVGACAALGLALDAARATIAPRLVARVAVAFAALPALTGSPSESLPVLVLATLVLLVDAVRADEPWLATGAAVTAPAAVATAGALAGLAVPEQGVVLAGAAAVLAGLAALAPERWRTAVLLGAAAFLGAGLTLASGDAERFAEAMILTGGLVVATGAVLRRMDVVHGGGAIACAGIALHLVLDGVTASEPYLLPIALQLVVLGVQLRRRVDPPSSWVAFGPAIGLLGASALAERLSGGSAWHALAAGAVGVTAIAVGGWQRLAAPLFLGTAIVATVTVIEALHTLAGVPTWGWLALGGAGLLTAGVALERTSTSPSEAGRRLVDVVTERFE